MESLNSTTASSAKAAKAIHQYGISEEMLQTLTQEFVNKTPYTVIHQRTGVSMEVIAVLYAKTTFRRIKIQQGSTTRSIPLRDLPDHQPIDHKVLECVKSLRSLRLSQEDIRLYMRLNFASFKRIMCAIRENK